MRKKVQTERCRRANDRLPRPKLAFPCFFSTLPPSHDARTAVSRQKTRKTRPRRARAGTIVVSLRGPSASLFCQSDPALAPSAPSPTKTHSFAPLPSPRTSPMANTLRPYLQAVRHTLTASMCLQNFASQIVERHNVPEVEAGTSKEVLLNPLVISRTATEKTMIERTFPRADSGGEEGANRAAGASHRSRTHAASFVLGRRCAGFGRNRDFAVRGCRCEPSHSTRRRPFAPSPLRRFRARAPSRAAALLFRPGAPAARRTVTLFLSCGAYHARSSPLAN